ncbi:hypothetical protein LOK74_04090 [Brevibacillus humidisoli]|uniref:hypothetical protein n=1 Tax=Brevibacillus humidisoli TaxID=2895522 RepID=UPI001E32AA6D|nr:hypothetical protein [Brevibacillus humidisoli]UFJ41703.1 hypothetical protein LOK74_04090 [Brevibacillus humidisoli]
MQLRSKSLTGVVQSLSFVDNMLRQQGFRRGGEEHAPLYDVVIFDSATSISYYLRIPTSVSLTCEGTGEKTVKIGRPYLETKLLAHKSVKDLIIPEAVQRAAEHKLAEIADYLASAASATHERLT